MFRAQLIENQQYYKLRRRQLFYSFLTIIPGGLLVSLFEIPPWAGILVLVGYLAAFFFLMKNQKALHASVGDSWLEIDQSTISIKTKAGRVKETIKLDGVRGITLQEDYTLPMETLSHIKGEALGDQPRNLLEFRLADGPRRFYFELDSHYNLVQLQELITFWKEEGYVRKEATA